MVLPISSVTDDRQLVDAVRQRIVADFQGVTPSLTLRFVSYSQWTGRAESEDAGVIDDFVCVTDRGSFPIRLVP